VYVTAAKALGVDLPIMELFFVSTLQNIVSHLPITPSGVGLREATAVGLYAAVGLPQEQAVLIPLVGFAVDMAISSSGGLFLLGRKDSYAPDLRVEDDEREARVHAQIELAPESEWPRVGRGAAIGLGAGLLAGLLIGATEALLVVQAAHGRAEPDVWLYATLSYAVSCGAMGCAGAAVLAYSGRLMARRAVAEPTAFAHLTAGIAAAFAFVIGAFRVQRDVFHEELKWLSAQGLMVLLGAVVSALVVYVVLFFLLRTLTERSPARVMLRPWGSLGVTALVTVVTLAAAVLMGEKASAFRATEGQPTASRGNVLFIVVDTLRADHLPAYGYRAIQTPGLSAFEKDAVLFELAFANASWTRPSFASLLTGRYASSHGVMSKAASLPDQVETIAEAFSKAGYTTGGVVTNYNVAPFFNFQQGFDEYQYLTPDFLFGASDTSAKLSLLQIFKRVDEKVRALLGSTQVGSAYQDAPVVNRALVSFLDRAPKSAPWFLFAGYMDPHDPYFTHPYDGTGYSRAAHVKPDGSEADRLRRLYDGEIVYWDEHFGALIGELKRRGLYDDLTIVVTADHGEEFMDHGGFWHGTTLYDEQLHVPLLVKLPKNERAGQRIGHWVESVDVMPSLLKLQGLEVSKAVQGIDLFRGKEQTFAEESHEGNVLSSVRLERDGAKLKLIKANAGNPRGLAERELYRVDTDAGERDDLAPRDPAALSAAQQTLDAASKQAQVGALKAKEVDLAVDQAAEERLKALGYAEH
jgi:arylsulfatase A-like enzyme